MTTIAYRPMTAAEISLEALDRMSDEQLEEVHFRRHYGKGMCCIRRAGKFVLMRAKGVAVLRRLPWQKRKQLRQYVRFGPSGPVGLPFVEWCETVGRQPLKCYLNGRGDFLSCRCWLGPERFDALRWWCRDDQEERMQAAEAQGRYEAERELYRRWVLSWAYNNEVLEQELSLVGLW